MIRFPLKYRNQDDDQAPIDYNFVGSVAEGQRQRQSQSIHAGEGRRIQRHQTDPNYRPPIDQYGTRARRSDVAPTAQPRLTLPVAPDIQPAVQSIAYPEQEPEAFAPQGTQAAFQPEPPAAFQPELQASPAASELTGPEFDAPVSPEMPEWLRVAQQNHMSQGDRPARRPQVTAAPAHEPPPVQTDILGRPIRTRSPIAQPQPLVPESAKGYEAAGYPEELVWAQQAQEREREAQQYASKYHGAQAALGARQRAQQRAQEAQQTHAQQPTPSSYPPPREPAQSSYPPPREPAPSSYPPPRESFAPTYAPPKGYAQEFDDPVYRFQPEYDPSMQPRSAPQPYTVEPETPAPRRGRREAASAPIEPYVGRNPNAAEKPYPAENPYVTEAYDQPQPEEALRRRIPWLGIAASTVALVAILLWILQMSFTGSTADILKQREETAAAIADAHPYRYRELIETQAQVNNLHPAFIAAIVLNESSFKPDAESNVGARGLMQVMQDTGDWVHKKIGDGTPFNFDTMYDATTNVRYACWYINYLSGLFRGDPVLVAAAFHAGQGTVQNWLNDSRYSQDSMTIALEDMMDGPTKNYATRVLRAYSVYKRLYYEDAAQ